MLRYFTKGFELIREKWCLVGVYFLLSILETAISLITKDNDLGLLWTLPTIFLFLSFSLSMPLFLVAENNKLTSGFVVKTALHNAKRLLLPALVLFIVLLIALFSLAIGVVTTQTNLKITAFLFELAKNYNPYQLIFVLTFSLLTFTPTLFSVENLGVGQSITKSITYSIKSFPFIIVVFAAYIAEWLIGGFIPRTSLLGELLLNVWAGVVALVVGAASLVYYQQRIKKL